MTCLKEENVTDIYIYIYIYIYQLHFPLSNMSFFLSIQVFII